MIPLLKFQKKYGLLEAFRMRKQRDTENFPKPVWEFNGSKYYDESELLQYLKDKPLKKFAHYKKRGKRNAS